LLYNALSQGIAEDGLNLEQILLKMIAAGQMTPGAIGDAYMNIYRQAEFEEIIPY